VGSGLNDFDGDDFPPKQPRMRWNTYRPLELQYEELQGRWVAGLTWGMASLLERAYNEGVSSKCETVHAAQAPRLGRERFSNSLPQGAWVCSDREKRLHLTLESRDARTQNRTWRSEKVASRSSCKNA
jgi:hypothetical protein